MYNLFEIFDDYHKNLLKKYNIEIKNTDINEEEYTKFLSQTNKMSIEDMEDIYDYLDDYFEEENNQSINNESLMKKEFLDKEVEITKKNGKKIVGKILYWIQEQGEREYILINNECIYIDEIEFIFLLSEINFLKHFNKDVIITLKNGKEFKGHVETFTRSVDSDNNQPSLTVATSDGYYEIEYNDVDKVIDID